MREVTPYSPVKAASFSLSSSPMQLRAVVWPLTALWKAVVLCCLIAITIPIAIGLAIGELRDWKRRTL
jgi:hypothetical protein